MSWFSKLVAHIKAEPAVLLSLVGAGITVATDFGLHLTATQISGVDGVVAVLTGLLIRSQVTPTRAVPVPQPAQPAAPVGVPPLGPTAGP
jgi:hypothetical protein